MMACFNKGLPCVIKESNTGMAFIEQHKPEACLRCLLDLKKCVHKYVQ
jgi:hypothetical protein